MKKEETTWKIFKKVLRWFDFSGESFTFKYKDKDKLSTISAGIIYLIFYILALLYFIYIFIHFLNKEIFQLQYYVMNSDQNENIKLDDKTTTFAFGLTNDNNDTEYHISDLFTIETKFTTKSDKGGKNNINKTYKQCSREDFKNIESSSILEKIEEFKCFDKNDLKDIPVGIFTDHYFSYYTIIVKSKYENNETYDRIIDDYLTKNDCKLQYYYTDIKLNLSKSDKPFSYIINSMFLQLNPNLIQKKNIFYMNYLLENDVRLFQLSMERQKIKKRTGLSRVEDYAEYKGTNRTLRGYGSDTIYAKIYIRADNRKIIIKRNYQDLMEFYADKSSLWLSLYWFLCFLFALYDRENASHSISKRLFYFEGIKDNKYNKCNELKKIKELIDESQEKEKNNQNNNKNKVFIYTERNIRTSKPLKNNFLDRRDTNSTLNIDLEKIKKNKKQKSIDYESYNLFEVICSYKLFFCKSKNFESKVKLFNEAKNLFDDRLDIIFYIRNMFKFELINSIYLENANIIDFLSRPIIHLNDTNKRKKKSKNLISDKITNTSIEIEDYDEQREIDEKMKMEPVEVLKRYRHNGDESYKTSYNLDSDDLTKNIENLLENQTKTKAEIKMISYLEKQLEGVH